MVSSDFLSFRGPCRDRHILPSVPQRRRLSVCAPVGNRSPLHPGARPGNFQSEIDRCPTNTSPLEVPLGRSWFLSVRMVRVLDYIAGIDLALGYRYPALTQETDKLHEVRGHPLRWIGWTVGYVVM